MDDPTTHLKEQCGKGKFKCAARIFEIANPVKSVDCSPSPNNVDCHLLEGDDDNFFSNTIDEDKLMNNFGVIMKHFIADLDTKVQSNSDDIKDKIKNFFSITSTDDIISIKGRTKNTKTNNCKDNIGLVFINHQPKEGQKKSYDFFHIAIHSRTSRYEESGTIGSCGYWERTTGSGKSGPFHYKIDTKVVDDLDPKNHRNKPYKRFNPDETGSFEENAELFKIATSDAIAIPSDIQTLHNFFYKEFREFWNNTVIKDNNYSIKKSHPLIMDDDDTEDDDNEVAAAAANEYLIPAANEVPDANENPPIHEPKRARTGEGSKNTYKRKSIRKRRSIRKR